MTQSVCLHSSIKLDNIGTYARSPLSQDTNTTKTTTTTAAQRGLSLFATLRLCRMFYTQLEKTIPPHNPSGLLAGGFCPGAVESFLHFVSILNGWSPTPAYLACKTLYRYSLASWFWSIAASSSQLSLCHMPLGFTLPTPVGGISP